MTPDAPMDWQDELEATLSDIEIFKRYDVPAEVIAAAEERAEEIRAEIAAQENTPSPTK